MKYKKLKKLQHNRRATAYRTKKMIYENNPQSAALLELAHDIKKENIWQMPYVGRDQLADAEEYNATEDDICNYVRTQTIQFTINWTEHTGEKERQKLKPIAENHEIVRWQALLSNVSVVNDNGKLRGFILLDKVVQLDPDSTDMYIGFRRSLMDNLLDYHMWLPIDRILYFGNKNMQEMAQGDCLMGYSYIVPYHTKGKKSYGFGKTIITDCGVVAGDKDIRTVTGWKAVNGEVLSDYSREDDWLIKLEYGQDYQMQLNRYADKTLENLRHIRPKMHIHYQTDNQVNYQERFDFAPLPDIEEYLMNNKKGEH